VVCAIANQAGVNVEYPIHIAATDTYVTQVATYFKGCLNPALKVKFSYGNENWNSTFVQFYYLAAQPASPASGWFYSGYRGAQIMELIYNVYGSSQRSRWIGAMGSQMDTSKTTDVITGANIWIAGGATHTLTQLFDQVDVAPYFGPFYGGGDIGQASLITNITASATAVVTTSTPHGYSNGKVLKLFVTGGTMAAALDSQYVTISGVTSTTFQINISTAGLTYGASGSDNAWDATIFKLIDRSVALNGSTPATYPTKFSYFTQEFSKITLDGIASDASYGTLTMPGNQVQSLQGIAGTIQPLLKQHALIANSNNLKLSEYEGGPQILKVNSSSIPVPQILTEYIFNYGFDRGVTGNSTYTMAGLYAAVFQALRDVNSVYSAQYTDLDPQAAGGWGAMRFIPGDEANPKWQALVTENALGPYVDPTPAATGVFRYQGNGTNKLFTASGCSSCTDTFTPDLGTTGQTLLIVVLSLGGGTPTGTLTCGGVSMTADNIFLPVGDRAVAIYSGVMAAGASTRTCNMVYSGTSVSSQQRTYYAMTATGLASNLVQATNQGGAAINPVNEIKGSLIVAMSACFGTHTTSSGVASGATSILATDADVNGTGSFAVLDANFSSTIFAVTHSCSGSQAAAIYR
jgi:hypothetical protein